MSLQWFPCVVLSVVVLMTSGPTGAMADERENSPKILLRQFAEGWADDAWEPKGEGRFSRYIRSLNDEGWQVRLRTIQGLIAAGEKSVAPLIELLRDGKPHERILAAQALGYLGANVPREPLLAAAKNDADAAVRLYAVDSLGMLGGMDLSAELSDLAKSEKNGDVKRHIAYALERRNTGIEPQIVDGLIKWDSRQINSAKLGEQAPDFELAAVTGEKVRLSDFRGKQAVVLVFIYGDT